MQEDSVDWNTVPSCICSSKEYEQNRLEDGDIVFARTGATTGKSYLVRELKWLAVFASYLIRVRPNKKVDSLYLSYFFKSSRYWHQITAMANGAAQPGVNSSKLRELEIPLPPLAEQKRIASILDKADAIRRKRQHAIQLADEFLHAVFLNMFGDPVTNPKGWDSLSLEQVAAKEKYSIKAGPFGSSLKKEDYVPSGYKIYGQEQVIRDDLAYGDYFIDEEKYRNLESCSIAEGDLLISLVGTFGKIAVVPKEFEPGIINPRLMKLSFDRSVVDPWFMKYLLSTPGALAKISHRSHGGTMGIVNVGIMKELEIPIPPLLLQRKFLEVKNKSALVKAGSDNFLSEPLLNTISQKAFSGQL